jgi:hypothetical protein
MSDFLEQNPLQQLNGEFEEMVTPQTLRDYKIGLKSGQDSCGSYITDWNFLLKFLPQGVREQAVNLMFRHATEKEVVEAVISSLQKFIKDLPAGRQTIEMRSAKPGSKNEFVPHFSVNDLYPVLIEKYQEMLREYKPL